MYRVVGQRLQKGLINWPMDIKSGPLTTSGCKRSDISSSFYVYLTMLFFQSME